MLELFYGVIIADVMTYKGEVKMEHTLKIRRKVIKGFFAVTPLVFLLLFFLLKGNRTFMNFWVFEAAGPFEQTTGRLLSVFPFSVMEAVSVAGIAVGLIYLIYSFISFIRNRDGKKLFKRLSVIIIVCLWLLAAFYLLWNSVYCADNFKERSKMEIRPYSVEELARVTDYFAFKASQLAGEIKRDENGDWDESLHACIQNAPQNYSFIEEEFPFLKMKKSVEVKPFYFSRWHSRLGFTGMYMPYTGEANINIDAPGFLIPSTICHEMTHQRMVAPEDECNFAGITACCICDDKVFQYAGYMSGLIHLGNALYPSAPVTWQYIVETNFNDEMSHDWKYNSQYWAQFDSPVEKAADAVYDKFLKSNGQELGKKSYGACVDLLISYFLPEAEDFYKTK